MEPHPVYNTENKNKLPQRSPGKCKSHTPTNTGKQQQRLEDLLGERAIKQQQPAHKQGVHLSVLEGANWREKVSVRREREKARVGVKVELSSKQSQIPPAPPLSQVNCIIRSQGRYRHHLP